MWSTIEYLPTEYTDSMTLIMGKVCSDGTIIASDSKASYPGTEPHYDKKKIFNFGEVAIAVAGSEMEKLAPQMIAGAIQIYLRKIEQPRAHEVINYLKEYGSIFLISQATKIAVLVADPSSIWIAELHTGTFEQGNQYEGGIDDILHPETISDNTTGAYKKYFEDMLELNEGSTVGGNPQIAILKPTS